MNEYELGKDIQAILTRLEKLEARERELSTRQCRCAGMCQSVKKFSEETDGSSYKGELRRVKTWPWGRRDAGDCEWRFETVSAYDDGWIRIVGEIKDHGTIFGDTFQNEYYWHIDSNADCSQMGGIVASYFWQQSLGAGGRDGFDKWIYDDAIRRNFDALDCLENNKTCLG